MKLLRSLRLLLPALALAALPAGSVEIVSVDDVQAGMRGTGYTVWQGAEIEPFEVEILGVLRHAAPGRHIILAEAHGEMVEEVGIPQGISGSPVYLDGKLLGACAYTWSFAKKPVLGITPIEYMLDLMARQETGEAEGSPAHAAPAARRLEMPAFDPSRIHALHDGAEPVFIEPLRRFLRGRGAVEGMTPIGLSLSLSGLPAATVEPLRELFGEIGVTPVTAGGYEASSLPDGADTSLRPGAAVGAALVRGDLGMDAFGTVTHVAGDHVFAFGHPFFGMGPVEFPLSEGWVHTVLPRRSISFKVISHVRDVGVVRQDRDAGLYGVLGQVADMVPLDVELERGDGAVESYHLEIIRDPVLTPLLTWISLQSVLASAEKESGEATIEVLDDSVLKLRDYTPVGLQNFYSGETAGWELSGTIASYLAWVMNNEFETPHVEGVELRLRYREGLRTAAIERVQFGRDRVRPGETVPVEVFLRPWRGELRREVVDLAIPEDLPEGSFQVMVGSAADVDRLAPEARGGSLASLLGLLELIHGMRRNEALYVQLSRPGTSLLVRGEVLPGLPPTAAAMLRSNRVQGPSSVTTRSDWVEEEVLLPWRLDGVQLAEIEIRGD